MEKIKSFDDKRSVDAQDSITQVAQSPRGAPQASTEETESKTLYQKIELISSADENGKYWEIRSSGETLREADLVEMAEWIARELGWIRK
jgi:hypothetical protein